MPSKRVQRLPEPAHTMTEKLLKHFEITELEHLRPVDLTNRIHPIFRRRNWINGKTDVYPLILPALRLASKLLTNDEFLPWWVTAVLGRVGKPVKLRGYESELPILDPPPVNRHNLPKTKDALDELANYVRFQWDDLETEGLVHAETVINHDIRHYPRRSPIFKHMIETALIRLTPQMHKFIAGPRYARSSASLQQRIQLFIAFTLVHEVAHALAYMRFGESEDEMLHGPTDVFCEMGFSWENWAFGAQIMTNDYEGNKRREFSIPFHGFVSEPYRTPEQNDRTVILTAIPMTWVNQWFQTSTWKKIGTSGRSVVGDPVSKLRVRKTRHALEWVLL